jgi:AcrR family transcriptional regulator
MPRAGLTPALVTERAAEIADEVGLPRLTLALVAQAFNVQQPSLYKHVRGLDGLLQRIASLSTAELAQALTDAAAGRSGSDALHAVGTAYRGYAHAHPGRYAASLRLPASDDADHAAAAERAVQAIYAILRGYGLDGDEALDATRALRSALHGFVTLEQAGSFGIPRDLDVSFDQLIAAHDVAFRSWPARS